MLPIRSALLSSVAAGNVIPVNLNINPCQLSLYVKLSAGAVLTYNVEYTYDDINSTSFNAGTATWLAVTNLSAKTAAADGNIQFPVMAVRLNVTAYTSGTAQLIVTQAGI